MLLAVTIATDAGTQFIDDGPLDLDMFGLADINPSVDFVEVNAFEDADGNLVANQVKRDDPEDESLIEGVVDNVTRPDLVIAGVSVTTDAQTECENANEMPISADDFFAAALGRAVKAKGIANGGVLTAHELELED